MFLNRNRQPITRFGIHTLVELVLSDTSGATADAILPDRDAVGQLATMADRCEQLFGQRPAGMWLAERVWEPDLPRVIAEAGYRYTLLDDTHLLTDPLLTQRVAHLTRRRGDPPRPRMPDPRAPTCLWPDTSRPPPRRPACRRDRASWRVRSLRPRDDGAPQVG